MPSFEYTLNIPDGPHNPSADQGPMQVNTNSINSILEVDHFSFSSALGGTHQQVNLASEASPPILGNMVLYTRTPAISGQNVLWAKSAAVDAPLYYPTLSGAANGVSSMFGGIIFQWGFSAISASGTATPITFTIPFPTNAFSITIGCITNEGVSPGENNYFIQQGTVSKTGFSIVNSSSSSARSLYWMAIGN